MLQIIQKIRKVLQYGQLESHSHTQNRKIFNVNFAAFIAIASTLLYSSNLLVFIGSDVAMVNLIATSPFLILYLVPLWLNYHNQHTYASFMMSFSITASVALSVWVISGTLFNLHYYFILFAIAPLLFFSSKKWFALLVLYFINIALFIRVEYFHINTWWEINQTIDTQSQFYVQASNVAISLATLWFIAFLSERSAQHNEERLEKLLAESKKLQHQIIDAKEKAESANKAKSEFLANMSHEIRTPMNSVLGFSEIMFNTASDKKQKDYLKTILSSGRTLMSLINDILDISRIEAGRMEINNDYKDIKVLIMEMEQVFLPKIMEKNLEFFVECDPELPQAIFVDEVRLRQILLNLIGNAVKFTHYGSISIYAGMTKGTNGENNFKIDIKDTGIGINPEDQERIFESFTQQHGQDNRKYGGTGLGLAISKRLCELMNAKISLNSAPGAGSCFTVLFKNVKSTNRTHKEYNAYEWNDLDMEFFGQKVLIVDDLPNNRQLIRDYLQSYNLQILEAENGEIAIEKAKTSLPDIIFMDIRMPVMGGYEATQIIKSEKETSTIPVVALTASSMHSETDKINALFDAYLRKPVQKKTVIQELTVFLKHEISTPKNSTSQDAAESIADAISPALKVEFKKQFDEEIQSRKDIMLVQGLNDLHQNLLHFALQNNLNNLSTLCKDLKESIESFDFDRIQEKLNEILRHYT